MLNIDEIVEPFKKTVKQKIVRVKRTQSGHSSIVFEITTEDEKKYYFKQGNNNYSLQYELHLKLQKMDVFVPKIISYNDRWIIEEGVSGQRLDLTNTGLATSTLEKLGSQISLIHQLKTNNYGPLISLYSGKYKDYSDYYRDVIQLIPNKYINLVSNYLNNDHKTVLNHGDLCSDHTYVDQNNNLVYIIDWDDILSAPKEFDLSELLLNLKRNKKYWDSFMKGYCKNNEYIEIYNKNILVAQLLQVYESYLWYKRDSVSNKNYIIEELNRIKEIENIIDDVC